MWAMIKSWFTRQRDHDWKYRKSGKHRKCLVCNRSEHLWKLESGDYWLKRNRGRNDQRCSEK